MYEFLIIRYSYNFPLRKLVFFCEYKNTTSVYFMTAMEMNMQSAA
jgi:hypothetical protein